MDTSARALSRLLLSARTLAVLVSLTVSAPAGALTKPDFRINTDGGKTEQNHPRIALRPGGGFVVVWTDYRYGQPDIFCQLFDKDANPVGQNRRLNTDTSGAVQLDPVAATASDGRVQLFWTDYRQNGYPFDPGIATQSLAADGSPVGTNRMITTEFPDSLKGNPDVAINPVTGEIIVVWEDFRNLHWDIYAQFLSAEGISVGGNRRINDDLGSAQQHSPRIDCSPGGWFAIVWYDNRETNDDIFCQLFRPDHSLIGSNLKVNSGGLSSRQVFPDVACDGTGRFTVAWVDYRDGIYPQNPNIYARRFDTLRTSLSSDQRLNSDQTLFPQRDVCISADPRGNVAVVWSDSTERQWDLTGQMISVDGQVKEENFLGHVLRDSSQLRPDVALDGHSRFLVWVDNRNGNWDIYGRIVEYNTPRLVLSVSAMQFERVVGDLPPDSQRLVVSHLGYNPISFRLEQLPDWLHVRGSSSAFTGLTPETLYVSIHDTGLASGTVGGLLRFSDLDNKDSSTTLSVTYRIGQPIVAAEPDTLLFRAVPFLSHVFSQSLRIRNSGVGTLQWSASSSASWCTITPSSGQDSLLVVQVAPGTLDTGRYGATIVVRSAAADSSADTVQVLLKVEGVPFLDVQPDSLPLVQSTLDTTALSLQIRNLGNGTLHSMIRASVPWIQLADSVPDSTGGTTARINAFNLRPGQYSGLIIATDSSALNIADSCLVRMTVHFPSQDSLYLSDLSLANGQQGIMNVVFRAKGEATAFDFPLQLPDHFVRCDSVQWSAGDWGGTAAYDSASGRLILTATPPLPLAAGSLTEMAQIYLTALAGDTVCQVRLDPRLGRALHVIAKTGDSLPVALSGGVIHIQTGTDVGDELPVPASFHLYQNYPNPF